MKRNPNTPAPVPPAVAAAAVTQPPKDTAAQTGAAVETVVVVTAATVDPIQQADVVADAGSAPSSVSPDFSDDDDERDERDEHDPGELFTPLVKARAKALILEQLALAERDERSGPGGLGWQDNESKRPEVEQWAAFMRMVAAQLPRL